LSGASFVTPAVWVNEGDILRPEVGELVWDSKMNEPARLLFAGRLATANGIDVLLAALRSLDAQRMEVRIDVVGDGERRNACLEAARSLRSVHLSVLDPVPYGIAFFELIRRYHAVLVPTVGDEQPRILFDASAQAVPVIATQTNGIRPYVRQGRTGWLVPVGEVAALGAAVQRARAALPELRRMGMTALLDHRVLTHRAMHRRRSHLIRAACT
jgi:glycosyltransferase involved in cell wall biosynthesis